MGCTPVFDFYASAAGTAQLLTTSYVTSAFGGSSGFHRLGEFNSMALFVTLGGTVTTSVEWRLVFSDDAGVTTFSDTGTEVSAGVVTHQELVEHITDDTGAPSTALTQVIHIDLEKVGADLVGIQVKRTGGDATSDAHITAQCRS